MGKNNGGNIVVSYVLVIILQIVMMSITMKIASEAMPSYSEIDQMIVELISQ